MSRFVLKIIENEEIFKNSSSVNYTSNIIGKTVNLTNESITIDEMLAQGGYGTVFKCHTSHSMFALKKLCVNSMDKLLTCIQEIYILKNVDSEHIMRYVDSIIYQSSSDIHDVFILTELYRGNLSSMMRTMYSSHRIFEQAMVVHMLSHIIKAVACLHQALPLPIIHRDLKVENILIAYPQRYVLCDFGSATLTEVRPCDTDRQHLREEISQCTTLSYRSPEMTDLYFDGGEHVIGRKSDIWALGVLMYNICFFSLPFGESVLSIMSGIVTVPDTHCYSSDLMKLLKFCLTNNPNKRPDVYQLSTIIFFLLSESNPILNTENSPQPCLDDLLLPMKESEAKAVNSNRIKKNRNNNLDTATKPVSTSIKPRERPKAGDKGNVTGPLVTQPISQSNSSSVSNLHCKQSQIKDNTSDDWCKNQSSISVLTNAVDSCLISSPPADELIDFKDAVNHKINQMGNVSKSQSLGKHFSSAAGGQFWNMQHMISQSYQNVPSVPQPLYCSSPPHIQPMYPMALFCQPQPLSQNMSYPINHTNSSVNMGHRRMVSEPMSTATPNQCSNRTVSHRPQPKSSSQGILQPEKIPLPITRTTVLNEFDPLTN